MLHRILRISMFAKCQTLSTSALQTRRLEGKQHISAKCNQKDKKVRKWLEYSDLTEPIINSLEITSMLSLKSKAENVSVAGGLEGEGGWCS